MCEEGQGGPSSIPHVSYNCHHSNQPAVNPTTLPPTTTTPCPSTPTPPPSPTPSPSTSPTPSPSPSPTCNCGLMNNMPAGRTSSNASKIFNGEETSPHEFPWIVKFVTNYGYCGGSLITNRHVITNAHCTGAQPVANMRVVLGLHDNCFTILDCRVKGENVVEVSHLVEHPEFSFQTPVHLNIDISILTLANPVTFSNTIRPICLPFGQDSYTHESAILAGWGLVGDNAFPNKLIKGQMKVNSYCYTTRHLCYTGDGADRQGCQGDSGSPVFLEENGRSEFEILFIL